MKIEEKKYSIERHDLSKDRSLRAWSAADEYLLQQFKTLEKKPNHLVIYNDRFGYLACHLQEHAPTLIRTKKSQEKAIVANLETNKIPLPIFSNPLTSLERKIDVALIKTPKSTGTFQLFLEQVTSNSTEDLTVICAFMTRHFTPKLLQIAAEYFDEVEQSKALKKARLLLFNKKKNRPETKKKLLTSLDYKEQEYRQYLGVFSGEHIDYATQYFLDHLELKDTDQRILDLGSGNGIIGHQIFRQLPDSEIHLMDDYFLAVASAQLNIQGDNIHHHFNNELSIFEDHSFDLIVTNPPFHFEYEINIQIPLQLFKACHRCLKTGGNLQMVANRHLNYKVHLERTFASVEVVAENEKFVIYKCTK